MSTEEKFRAAVNVIQGLPEDGPFKPSNNLKLKFYGYFKQATNGPNLTAKPYMWEVIKRAKWDAWNDLGNMTKEDAMLGYLQELNIVVERMAASGNVDEALAGMDEFYARVPVKDVDLCIGATIEKIKAKSTTLFPSRPVSSEPMPYDSGQSLHEEDEDEFFLDSVETIIVGEENRAISSGSERMVHINGHSDFSKDVKRESSVDILSKSLISIRNDLDEISKSMKEIEQQQKSIVKGRRKLFGNLSSQTVMFIILWPILVNLGLIWIYSKKRRTH